MARCVKNSLIAIIGWLILTGVLIASDRPVLVGEYGNFELYELMGNDTFSNEEVRDALEKDLTLIPYSRTDRSFDELCTAIKEEISIGYLTNGFPDAQVEVDWDAQIGRPIIRIEEGERFQQGEVVVLGVEAEIENAIRQWLTESMPPLNAISTLPPGVEDEAKAYWHDEQGKIVKLHEPIWVSGEYAVFLPMAVEAFKPFIDRAIQDQGYHKPDYQIALVPQPETGKADLQIVVQSLGELWEIEEINIEGLERHSREEVLEYLDAKIGETITPQLLLRLNQKLVQSGAFRWSNVYAAPKLIPILPTELCIDLVESDEAPKLLTELDQNQKTALKFVDWINRFDEQETDLVIEFSGLGDALREEAPDLQSLGTLTMGHSPRGLQVYLLEVQDPFLKQMEKVFIAWDQTSFRFALIERRIIFEHRFTEPHFSVWSFTLRGQPREAERPVSFGFSLGSGNADRPSVVIFEPFPVLRDVTRFTGEIADEGGKRIFSNEWAKICLDKESGRLDELNFRYTHDDEREDFKIHAYTEKGGLAKLMQSLFEKSGTASPREFVTIQNFEDFAMAAIEQSPGFQFGDARSIQAWTHVARSSLQTLRDLMDQKYGAHDADVNFHIPSPGAVNNSYFWTGSLVHAVCTDLFAERATLLEFVRESCAALLLKDPVAGPYLLKIVGNPKNGPIMNWLFAEVSASLPFLPTETLVERALEHFDDGTAEQDFRQFTNPQGMLGQVLQETSRSVRTTDQETQDHLLSPFSEDVRGRIQKSAKDTSVNDEEFAILLLTRAWEDAGLKELIERRLYQLIDDPSGSRIRLTGDEK